MQRRRRHWPAREERNDTIRLREKDERRNKVKPDANHFGREVGKRDRIRFSGSMESSSGSPIRSNVCESCDGVEEKHRRLKPDKKPSQVSWGHDGRRPFESSAMITQTNETGMLRTNTDKAAKKETSGRLETPVAFYGSGKTKTRTGRETRE